MSRLKIVRYSEIMGMGSLGHFWKSVTYFSCATGRSHQWHALAFRSVSTFEPQNSYCDSDGLKVGKGFVVGVQLPPTALLPVMILLGLLAFCYFFLCSRIVVYLSCSVLLINSNTVDISGE